MVGMTYEEFCRMAEKRINELDPKSAEIKEFFRRASRYHYDHLWAFLKEKRLTRLAEHTAVQRKGGD
jgi:hypothetical protein